MRYQLTVYDNTVKDTRKSSLACSKTFVGEDAYHYALSALDEFPWHFQYFIEALDPVPGQSFSYVTIMSYGLVGVNPYS